MRNEYSVCRSESELRTDSETIRTGTDTVKCGDDSVLFRFSCKHTCGTGETNELPYWELAHCAGRIALPKLWRSFTVDESGKWHESQPLATRETI